MFVVTERSVHGQSSLARRVAATTVCERVLPVTMTTTCDRRQPVALDAPPTASATATTASTPSATTPAATIQTGKFLISRAGITLVFHRLLQMVLGITFNKTKHY